MSLMWGAVVGSASIIPYFYSVFFIVVLIHRCSRDFERCVSSRSQRYEKFFHRLHLDALASMEKIGIDTAKLSGGSSFPTSTRMTRMSKFLTSIYTPISQERLIWYLVEIRLLSPLLCIFPLVHQCLSKGVSDTTIVWCEGF